VGSHDEPPLMPIDAIVLAGDRGPHDPVAVAAGVVAKCLTPIGGIPMVTRVVRALEQSGRVGRILLCGPAEAALETSLELREMTSENGIGWIAPQSSPCTSAAAALATLPSDAPVLVTTGDHALLQPTMVREFLDQALVRGGDVAVALAPYDLVRAAYPQTRRTVLKFSDGRFCGCNLFAFLTARGREMVKIWRQVEDDRKNPIRVIGLVGWGAMARYALGALSLADGVRRISKQTEIAANVITLPFAEAAIDVDSVADLDLVRAIVAKRG
jgi:GTP:adenosylcobinamide-phosphate guanylyltransferase